MEPESSLPHSQVPATSNVQKIRLNIIFPSMPGSPKWSLSLSFSYKNPVYASPLSLTRYMPRLSHSPRNFIEVIIQHCPQTKQCEYYCTQHTSTLSQSEAHSTDATVDEQTNSQSQVTITALASFSDYFSTNKCAINVECSCRIF